MHVCAWDFQPQSSPSVCAHSVPCFYWSRRCCGEKNNRNFICHWLSPLTVVSDVFYTHSTHIHIDTHTHRRAAVLTNVTHTLPSQRCYQDYNTVMDTSWNFIKFHTISVCVSMCFFLCVCVSVCLFWVQVGFHTPSHANRKILIINLQPLWATNTASQHILTHTGLLDATKTLTPFTHTHTQVHTHCKLHLWTNCAFKLAHVQGGHWNDTATEHTLQPDSPLMLSLWYLPLHHRLFISQPCCFDCTRIVILAVCWE